MEKEETGHSRFTSEGHITLGRAGGTEVRIFDIWGVVIGWRLMVLNCKLRTRFCVSGCHLNSRDLLKCDT
jgi:hypothetical protein